MKTFALLSLVALAALSAPLLAVPSNPTRPVLDAARVATPRARWQASQHLRKAYPGLARDLHSQLKARYPDLEMAVIEAVLDTWEAHPHLLRETALEVKKTHGEEIAAARKDVAQALEIAYPNFRTRLDKILQEKGPRATWRRFLASYNPELGEALPPFELSGTLLDHLAENCGDRRPAMARRAVEMMRRRSPALAQDFTARWLDGRKELANALQAEFPGAGQVVADTLQDKHPKLLSQVSALVEPRTRQARADLRANLDHRMPGFTQQVETLLDTRYPNLRQELIGLLKG